MCRIMVGVLLTYRYLSFGALDDGLVIQLHLARDPHACSTPAAVGERGADIIIHALGIGLPG